VRLIRKRLFRKRPPPAPAPGTARLPFGTRLAAWVWVLLAAGICAFSAGGGDDLPLPTRSWDKYLYLENAVVALALLLSLGTGLSALRAWRRTDLRRASQVKFSLVALAALALSWLAVHWNLLGPAARL